MSNDDHLVHLQGRIIALEFMMRGFLVGEMMKKQDPLSSLSEFKSGLFASLQHLDRPLDERSDAVWSEAVAAFEQLFAQTAQRLTFLLGQQR